MNPGGSLLLVVLLLMQSAPATPPRDAKAPAGSGTAIIAGRVIDAETEAPIAGALLQIGAKGDERRTEVEAGPRGEFRVEGLAAGDYTIVASPPEFRATHLPQIFNADLSQLMIREDVVSLRGD